MTPQYCALQCNSYATAGGCWLTAVRQQAMYSVLCLYYSNVANCEKMPRQSVLQCKVTFIVNQILKTEIYNIQDVPIKNNPLQKML